MTLKQIQGATDLGLTVKWSTDNYTVIKDSIGQWMIHSEFNDHYIGLTHRDNVTMNGREDQFYIKN